MTLAVVVLPGLRLKSPENRREHWRVARKRAAEQRGLTRLVLNQLGKAVRQEVVNAPRLRVRFVRLGGKKMDSDNLVAALKHCRDGLADWTGIDDRSDWYEWVWPAQEPGGDYGVRIELTAGAQEGGSCGG